MKKTDRRVKRTCELLQKALMGLIRARNYDAITVQDIVDRANIGRTTFYSHYDCKDDLFIDCHETMADRFQFGPNYPHSKEELLSAEPPTEMVAAYRHLEDIRSLLRPILQGNDGLLLRRIRDLKAQTIHANLRAAFAEIDSNIPITVLADYLAGAQTALMQRGMEKPQRYAPEILAQTHHRLQRAAIRDAFGLRDFE